MSERAYVILGILGFVIGILLFVYDTINNNLSTEGLELQQLQEKLAYYHTHNMLLKEKIYHEEAYTTIDKKAQKEGFTKDTKYFYLRQ